MEHELSSVSHRMSNQRYYSQLGTVGKTLRIMRTTAQLREETRSTSASLGTENKQIHYSAQFSKQYHQSLWCQHQRMPVTLFFPRTQTTRNGTNCCSHETLHHFGLQSSHMNTCAEHLCLVGSTQPMSNNSELMSYSRKEIIKKKNTKKDR